MPASTFEQLIATHGPMIARHDMRDTANFTTDEFIDTITNLGQLYATGMTRDLQTAADYLTAAASYLTDAAADATSAAVLIAHADRRLQFVNDLALA